MMPLAAGHARRRCSGFTLIELLIVIGVILILVALTLTVGSGMVLRSEIRETENTMRLLDVAVQEWETAVDRRVLYGLAGEPCDQGESYELDQLLGAGGIVQGYEANRTSNELWAILSRTTTVRDIIARVNPEFVRELDEASADVDRRSYRFLDAWDQPIVAVLPGRRHNRACEGSAYTINDEPDTDGSIRTPFENRFGVAVGNRIYFVSGGPSAELGNLHLDTAQSGLSAVQREEVNLAADNVYSYEVIIEQGRPE